MKAVAVFLLGLCCLGLSRAWTCEHAPQLKNVVQVDAGQGMVVALDSDGHSYFLAGSIWQKLSGAHSFQHVSVGPAGLWASDTLDRVYKYIGGNFVEAPGLSMQQVDAGGDQLVGVESWCSKAGKARKASCVTSGVTSLYTGAGNLASTHLPSTLTYYSCGPLFGCWGVGTGYRIYVTKSMNPTTCDTKGWKHVPGQLVTVEVGTDGTVIGVNHIGDIWQRTGISSGVHEGTGWFHIRTDKARDVSYDLGYLWVVTTSGGLLKCTA